ncbi:MAG: NAD(P)/FAD-dependent oxidoreductase [Methanobacterium sp.]|uniref:NAD(P)/FAD-dependent oxidoreductase n=1 Tax=Methanobacterium sp. TaxID=2164 RepID=UPI003D648280|nr:NAD(P)/FAD-dependent oxidoreductase [Methanobacterium sp.]
MDKVLISGAGLAGLSAAINLAKEGYEVNVFERNKDVGQRFHGDLQGLENWSEKEDVLAEIRKMSIDTNFDCHPFSIITATNSIKTNEVTTLKKPLYYLVKRGNVDNSLDFGLKEQALDAGVNIHFEKTINEEDADIVATGPVLENVVGVVKGITFKTDLKDTATVLFNNEAAFKGYSYLLVTKGYGCMSSVLLDNFNKTDSCFRKTKEFFSNLYKFNIEEARNCGGMGCFSINSRFKKGKTIFVGEAAGLQDLFLGFGMRYAITSGFQAARSIINDEDYEIMAKSCFEGKLKAGIVNRYLWEKLNKNNYSLAVNNFNWIINNFNWIYNYNMFWRILYPFALNGMRRRYNWFK